MKLEPVTVTIGGRDVVIVPDENLPRNGGDVVIDWSRWNFDEVRLGAAMRRLFADVRRDIRLQVKL